jgi:hypothetical protein
MVAAAAAVWPAFAVAQSLETQILSPGSTVAGKTIGEWTGKWWTWLLTSPLHRDPALDDSGEHCGVGQDGPVWFLAGSFSKHPVTRRCSVPEGKYVLFPMHTGITKPTPNQTQVTCKSSREKSARFADAVLGLYASINGVPIGTPERYRERTETCFDPTGTGRAISAQDGHWLMLRPLPPGKHILRFGRNEAGGRANTDVSFVLEVGKERSPAVIEVRPDESVPFPQRIVRASRASSPSTKQGTAGQPTHEDFPTYFPAVFRPRPGFGLSDFQQRLVALILREGKYTVVSHNRQAMGSIAEIRFTWPDVKDRYTASEDLKGMMPHPMKIAMTRNDDGSFRIHVAGVNPNAGPSFALRAEIVTDAARLVTEALDRRSPVTDEERLRALRYRAPDFAQLAGGDPWAEIKARNDKKREEERDRAVASHALSEQYRLQFTTGDFSAAGGELHAIGVYKGPERSGTPRPPSRITVYVMRFAARPIVLLLTAYEAVEWHVVGLGATVSKVIALGYHRQIIATAPADSVRVSRSFEDGYKDYFFSYGKDSEDVKKFYDRAVALTSEEVATFQGRYAGAEFFVSGDAPVRVEGRRVAMAARPKAVPVLRAPGDVHFMPSSHGLATITADGLSVSSCSPGASAAVKTNRAHVRGKVYFELTLNLRPGGLYPGTNVGMAPMTEAASFLFTAGDGSPEDGVGLFQWGEASKYRNGDVFGLAADFDARKLYFHVNGDWKGMPPGSQGVPLAAGKAYAAAASVSPGFSTNNTDCSGWTANFGKTPFKYPIPDGYMSYDGTIKTAVPKQRGAVP